ncbi:hypothetical protein [Candidatus Symbiopectobacterium sp. NZEC135]|uniref:hypothetical protein n=1 Tax=Candidatus Symbiopectobacterium sp. NZEC135 TaxID=2820471 RepID=UPI0022272AB6|nr:hypothetical protein [Candidatus Symbiopectobacterium sp. NZEC135]MCW2477765.1 hypothetical protein [Candidatus Symbiopectobacterium sp. NZEC135]
MDKFDRELQKHILSVCISCYPKCSLKEEFDTNIMPKDEDKILANISYLAEHNLLTIFPQRTDERYYVLDNLRATASGVDFMLNDGGLTSMLNIQTIRLHRDTVTALEDIIALSNISEPEKAGIVSKLRQLPADAITHLTNELVVKGALSLPAALPLIQKYLFGG